jgi:hypothetical protein
MKQNCIMQQLEKSHTGAYLQRGWLITSQKLQTGQLNLGGLQANVTRYSIISKASLG